MALCCFYDGQYDLVMSCFEKALELADDATKADIWYNVSLVYVSCGEVSLAHSALKTAICYDEHHAEAYNNLGAVSMKRGNHEGARYEFMVCIYRRLRAEKTSSCSSRCTTQPCSPTTSATTRKATCSSKGPWKSTPTFSSRRS